MKPLAALSCLLLCACPKEPDRAPPSPPGGGGESAPGTRPEEPPSPEPAAPEAPEPPEQRAVVLVTDLEALSVLSEAGGDFGALLGGSELAGAGNRRLSRESRWGSVARVLERDLRRTRRRDPKAGVGVRGNPHRLFDAGWLRGGKTRFELVGAANRIDRAPFSEGACGETRLVFRLAYKTEVNGETVRSRLPMTVLVALRGEARDRSSGCRDAARAWRAPADRQGEALGRWLTRRGGPLGPGVLRPERVTRIEVNMQSVRWPSSTRPDLGGHAEYVMRVFRAGEDARAPLAPAPLPFTPDTRELRRKKRLRDRLRAWIRDPENLARIDEGTAVLPEELAAKRAVSVTPRGLARRANRPFRQLFRPDDFGDLELEEMRFARSPGALLRRLDDQSCQGCHQSRTIAGFHLLGEERPGAAPGNALAVPISVHLDAEIERRRALIERLAAGDEGNFGRPFAERAPGDAGGYGSHCGLGDPGFEGWDCAEGLRCDPYDAPKDAAAVGVCLPDEPEVGDPCEVARIRPHWNPHRDRARGAREEPCGGGAVCNGNRVGFPGGMCAESCASLSGEAACGVIALLRPFNNCLARRTPFPDCLAEHVAPAGLRACDRDTPCRDDYICSRTPEGEGACIPPYFLFQLRVDGHPTGI